MRHVGVVLVVDGVVVDGVAVDGIWLVCSSTGTIIVVENIVNFLLEIQLVLYWQYIVN